MAEANKPFSKRTNCLAVPRTITPKYEPPPYIPGTVETGVNPAAVYGPLKPNWRIDELSIPNWPTKKYVYVPPKGVGSGVPASTLRMRRCRPRLEHLSAPLIRHLEINMEQFKTNPAMLKKLAKVTENAWDSMFNSYRKQMIEKEKKLMKKALGAIKGPRKTDKQIQEERIKAIKAWTAIKAKPKPVFLPPPPPPKQTVDLKKIAAHLMKMSEPKFFSRKWKRPSVDSHFLDPSAVSKAAQTYKPSERVLQLCKNPAFRLIKEPPYIPGKVNRRCLFDKVPQRFFELAVPRKRAEMVDNDVKENPFGISPNALKYVATARILELSKPTER